MTSAPCEPSGHLFVDDDPADTGQIQRLSISALMCTLFTRMIKDVISGNRRHSALFDSKTLKPIVAPARPIRESTAHAG